MSAASAFPDWLAPEQGYLASPRSHARVNWNSGAVSGSSMGAM